MSTDDDNVPARDPYFLLPSPKSGHAPFEILHIGHTDSLPYEPPPRTEHTWARRLGMHINRVPKGGQLKRRTAVRLHTLDSPERYTQAQIERACALAATLFQDTLVLCERPARTSSLEIDDDPR